MWTVKDIIAWHIKTFPKADLKSQKIKFLEEYKEYLESGDIMELADMAIVNMVLQERFYYNTFFNIMLDEQAKIKNLTELDNVICEKMDINQKRHFILKDGVYRHKES